MSIHVTVFKKNHKTKTNPAAFINLLIRQQRKAFLTDQLISVILLSVLLYTAGIQKKAKEKPTRLSFMNDALWKITCSMCSTSTYRFFLRSWDIYIYSKDKATDVRQPQRRPPLWHGGQTVSRGHRTHSSPSTAAKLKHLNIQTPSPASETPVSGNCSMLQVNYYNGSLPPYFKE